MLADKQVEYVKSEMNKESLPVALSHREGFCVVLIKMCLCLKCLGILNSESNDLPDFAQCLRCTSPCSLSTVARNLV